MVHQYLLSVWSSLAEGSHRKLWYLRQTKNIYAAHVWQHSIYVGHSGCSSPYSKNVPA